MEMVINYRSHDGNGEEMKSHYMIREVGIGQEPKYRPGIQIVYEAVLEIRVK